MSERYDPELIQVLRDIYAKLERIEWKQGETVSALDNLQAADAALKAEVTTFLADVAAKLGASDDAAVQAVADDINAEVAALQGGDPGAAPAAPAS